MTPSPKKKSKTNKPTLPNGWHWAKLGEVAEYINGRAFKPKDWKTSGTPIIRIQNLNSEDAAFNYFDGDIEERYIIENGDLLISWSASLDAFIWQRGKAILNQHIFKAVENQEVIRRDYLYYAVKEAMEEIRSQVHGATMKHITRPEFLAITIPLPPLDEQKRIAKRLNEELYAVEAARKAAEEQLQAAWELPSAYLREVFASKESQGWQTIKLGEILSSTKNGLYKPDKYYGQGKRILKMYNIGRLDGTWNLERVDLIDLTDSEYEDYRLNIGDILINRVNSRELVGKCAVIDESVDGAVYESKNIRIRLDTERAESDFVAAYINSKNGRDQFESRLKQIVGQATINRSDLDSFEIPLPPLKVQKQLIEELKTNQENARNLVASIESQLAEINTLPSALLGRAFAGGLL